MMEKYVIVIIIEHKEKMMIVGVLLPKPFNEPFDYKTDENVGLGDIVKVPFGKELLVGVVWEVNKTSKLDDKKIKKIAEKLAYPPLSSELRKFVEFVAACGKC